MEKWLWFVNSAGGAGAPPLHPEAQSVRVSRNPAIKLKQNGIGIIVDQVRIIESQWQRQLPTPRSREAEWARCEGGEEEEAGAQAVTQDFLRPLLVFCSSVTP
jgi:hypothetical protein